MAVAVREGRGVRVAVALAVGDATSLSVAAGLEVLATVAALAVPATNTVAVAGTGESEAGVGGAFAQLTTIRQATRASHSSGCRLTFWISMEAIMPAKGVLVNPAKSPSRCSLGETCAG